MELGMWVEVLSRHHHDVLARYRCDGDEIRIGRGYDNDVVLDDPFVAAQHLRLRRDDEGGWVAEDLGSTNGLYAARGKTRLGHIALDGEQIIRVGHTLLRLRAADWQVAAERIAAPQRALWPMIIALAVGIIGIEVTSSWLAETTEPRLPAYLAALQNVVEVTLGWVGVWTILCRVFTGETRFQRHLRIALTGVFVYSVFDELLKLAGFSLSLPSLLSKEYVVMWVVVAMIGFGHLQLIAPRYRRLNGSGVTALAILAIITATLAQDEAHRTADPPPSQGRLYPPALRLIPAQSEAQFFSGMPGVRDALQKSRKTQEN
jgi:hypothetical protein